MKIKRGGKNYRFTREPIGAPRKERRHPGRTKARRRGYDGAHASCRHPGCMPWGSGRQNKSKAQPGRKARSK